MTASVSDYIKLSADEEVIREYHGFKLTKPQNAALTIAVTSKRLIMYAMTKKALKENRSSFTREVRIDDIRGVDLFVKNHRSVVQILISLILIIGGIYGANRYGLFTAAKAGMAGLKAASPAALLYGIAGLIGLILLLYILICPSKVFALVIRGKTENLNLDGGDMEIQWSGEAQRVLNELGSLIIDVQEQYMTTSVTEAAKAASGYSSVPADYSPQYETGGYSGSGDYYAPPPSPSPASRETLNAEDFMTDSTESERYAEEIPAEYISAANKSAADNSALLKSDFDADDFVPKKLDAPPVKKKIYPDNLGLLDDAKVTLPDADSNEYDEEMETYNEYFGKDSGTDNSQVSSDTGGDEEKKVYRDDYLF